MGLGPGGSAGGEAGLRESHRSSPFPPGSLLADGQNLLPPAGAGHVQPTHQGRFASKQSSQYRGVFCLPWGQDAGPKANP